MDLYDVKETYAFNQFPHTIHIENIVSLELKKI